MQPRGNMSSRTTTRADLLEAVYGTCPGLSRAQAREVVEGAPIEITHLRVGMGRTQSEAVLSISSGPMTLLYSVELSSLLDLGDLIRSKTKRVPPTKN